MLALLYSFFLIFFSMRSIWGDIIMSEKKTDTDECPNCGGNLTYERFVTFREERIFSVVADWHSPDCGKKVG